MIGERDVVQVVMRVVGIERAPPAIPALHPDDPFRGPLDRPAIARRRSGREPGQPRRCRRDRGNGGSRIGRPSRRAADRGGSPPNRRPDPAPACSPASRARAGSPARAARRRPPSAHGRRARCPRPAIGRAGNSSARRRARGACEARPRRSRNRDDRADSPDNRTSSTAFAIAGKMPPSPSSPLSRSVTKATAFSIARRRGPFGKNGSDQPQQPVEHAEGHDSGDDVGPEIQSRTELRRLAEQFADRHGMRVAGARAQRHQHQQRHENGARPVGDLAMWNGDQPGSSMISTGMTGTARHGTSPNNASKIRVNTLQRRAPPRARIAARARAMCGASTGSPAAFSAK